MVFFKKPFTFENIPDLSGKVALITGANTGIGLITAREIARKGAHVFVCSRSKDKGEAAVSLIKEQTGNQNVEFLQLDLQNLKQVKKAAETFLEKGLPIHILINNAGIMATPYALSADGIEGQFATNHVGHFLFTTMLLPRIEESAPARIVTVSSFGHNISPSVGIDFENINTEKHGIWQRYGQSKLANILFTLELDRRLKDKAVYCNTLHPGYIKTELYGSVTEGWASLTAPIISISNALFAKSPEDGSLNQLYAATSPEIEEKNIRGKYFTPYAKISEPNKLAKNEELAKKLWTFTEELVAEKLAAPN
ncbi:4342_t:CDS:2 [Ambispora leptoticha]|uniref:4342_t:CDS:1 n=1 Tax=Ambispora leptoticha TaxID=144679 RepID=A0A9N9AMF3_9GLOM|nr:4342_t:CDS:2 [Ambispora leptoticha]